MSSQEIEVLVVGGGQAGLAMSEHLGEGRVRSRLNGEETAVSYRKIVDTSHADVRIPAPSETPVKVRNVAGLLRGSDPALKETYVIVSAHYDHIDGCAGADDNASGVAATLEIARLLAQVPFDRTVMIGSLDPESGLSVRV